MQFEAALGMGARNDPLHVLMSPKGGCTLRMGAHARPKPHIFVYGIFHRVCRQLLRNSVICCFIGIAIPIIKLTKETKRRVCRGMDWKGVFEETIYCLSLI